MARSAEGCAWTGVMKLSLFFVSRLDTLEVVRDCCSSTRPTRQFIIVSAIAVRVSSFFAPIFSF